MMYSSSPYSADPLFPGYPFDIFLVGGLTAIEKNNALDFSIDRPLGMKGYILNLTTRGKGEVTLGDEKRIVGPGDMLLFPPGVMHHYRRAASSERWHHRWVYFRPRAYWADWLAWGNKCGGIDSLSLPDLASRRELETQFAAIEQHHKQLRPMAEPLAMNLLESLLIRCYEVAHQDTRSILDPRIAKACKLITDNLLEEASVETLAKQVFLSPSRFTHLFRQQLGTSVTRWREQQRILHAKTLLQSTLLPIAVIGQQTGYDDPIYFSRVFRKQAGMSPSDYRQQKSLFCE